VWTLAGSARREPGADAATATASPLGTDQQLEAERIAAETVQTGPVKLMKAVLRLGWQATATREYDRISLEHGAVRWGPWTIESDAPGLEVRARRSGDRLAGRRKKLQDVFVDAKVPRKERDSWPVVVRDEQVVAVPGIVEDADVRVTRT